MAAIEFNKVDEDCTTWTAPEGNAHATMGRDDWNPKFWRANMVLSGEGTCFTTKGSYRQVRSSLIRAIRNLEAEGKITL